MNYLPSCFLSIFISVLVTVGATSAQTVPSGMTYQGRLTDASNAPVPDGTGYEIEVRLWSTAVPGAGQELLWGTRYSGVPLKGGAFNLIVGPGGTPISGATHTNLKAAFNNAKVYLGITMTKNAGGIAVVSSELIPRQEIFSTPYAFRADAVGVNGVDSSAIKSQAVDLDELSIRVAEKLTPTGMVSPFVGVAAPQGWLLCDGATVSRVQYAALFAIMGTSHGNGDGSTTFHLPDYRGRFLRGVDGPDGSNADRDPDSQSRTSPAPGGNAMGVGSVQDDMLRAHRHFLIVENVNSLMPDLSGTEQSIARQRSLGSPELTNANFEYDLGGLIAEPSVGRSGPSGGSETRSKNSAVNFIIKH